MKNRNTQSLSELAQAQATVEFESRDYERWVLDEYIFDDLITSQVSIVRSYFRDDFPVFNSTEGTINIAKSVPIDPSQYKLYVTPLDFWDDIDFDSKGLRGLKIAKKLNEYDLLYLSKTPLDEQELYIIGDTQDSTQTYYFKKVDQYTNNPDANYRYQYKVHVAKFNTYEKTNGNFTIFADSVTGPVTSMQLNNKNKGSLISKMVIDGEKKTLENFIPVKVSPTFISNNRVQLTSWFQPNKVISASDLAVFVKLGRTVDQVLDQYFGLLDEVKDLIKFIYTLSQLRQDNFAGGEAQYLAYWSKLLKDKSLEDTATVIDEIILKQIQLMDAGSTFTFVLENKAPQITAMSASAASAWKTRRDNHINDIKKFLAMASASFNSNFAYDRGGALANGQQLDSPWYFGLIIRPAWLATVYAGTQGTGTITLDIKAHRDDVFGTDNVSISSKYFDIDLATANDIKGSYTQSNSLTSDDLRQQQSNVAGTVGHVWMVADNQLRKHQYGYGVGDIKYISANQDRYEAGVYVVNELVDNALAVYKWTRNVNELNADFVSDDGKTIHYHRGEIGAYRTAILNKLNALTLQQLTGGADHMFHVFIGNAITNSSAIGYFTKQYRFDYDLSTLNVPPGATNISINWSMSLQASQGRVGSLWALDIYVPYLTLSITWTVPGSALTDVTKIFKAKDIKEFIQLDSQKVETGYVGDSIEAVDYVDLASAKKQEDMNKYIVLIEGSVQNIDHLNDNVQFYKDSFISEWPQLRVFETPQEVDLTFVYATRIDLRINNTIVKSDIFIGDETDDSVSSAKLWFV